MTGKLQLSNHHANPAFFSSPCSLEKRMQATLRKKNSMSPMQMQGSGRLSPSDSQSNVELNLSRVDASNDIELSDRALSAHKRV